MVNVDNINVAGTLKVSCLGSSGRSRLTGSQRRRSILPKQMPAAGPMDGFVNGDGGTNMGPPKAVLNSDDRELAFL